MLAQVLYVHYLCDPLRFWEVGGDRVGISIPALQMGSKTQRG